MSICNLDHFAESYWQGRHFGLVGGAFDPLHDGHIAYFEAARAVAPWLVCAVTPDLQLTAKRQPFLPELTRLKVLNSCTQLAHVHLAVHGKAAVIRALKPTHYIVGEDWAHNVPTEEVIACQEVGAALVTVECRENSSTSLLADYERRRNTEKLAAFERFVSQQKPAEKPWEPVTDYSFEARKAIEGPHAQLILDSFGRCSTLDAGCGPGHLVEMLRGLGADDVIGIDKTGTSRGDYYTRDIAIEWQGGVHGCFRSDLVICREVLEHLTVRQIAVAVRNLVKLSSRYVYLTTRFTAGVHLLDYDDRDHLDPTHISMLNPDLLRTLFVLEGCTRRADLESKLDWRKLGRCLVYEVPA